MIQDLIKRLGHTEPDEVESRLPVGSQPRSAARRRGSESCFQEPPRTKRRPQSPLSLAEPSVGAPL